MLEAESFAEISAASTAVSEPISLFESFAGIAMLRIAMLREFARPAL